MKYFILLILALGTAGVTLAQTTYESPHVKDGKTIQFTIPEGYFEMLEVGAGSAMYATQANVDMNQTDFSSLDLGLITVIHLDIEEENLESIKAKLVEESETTDEEVKIISTPEIRDVNGRDCLFAGFDGDFIGEGASRVYFSVIEFGDYFVLINYFSSEKFKEHLAYENFERIMSSWRVLDTDKDDGLGDFAEEENLSYEDEEDLEIYFQNDLFETEISYYDVLPDYGEGWEEVIDESGHLLSKFSYKEDNGSVKIFSGGKTSNYPSEEEMADAVELAMDWSQSMSLKFNTQFSNEDHVFKLYTISGGGTMSSVYTAIVNDELVFFVVDGGSNPVDDFKPAVRDFMLMMWVDYFDDSDE